MSFSFRKYGFGCSNGSCVWGSPEGMRTNGPCDCVPREKPNGRRVPANFLSLAYTEQQEIQQGIRFLRQVADLPFVGKALHFMFKQIADIANSVNGR